MNGKDDKAKKDDSATRPQTSTNISTKLREEKKGQQRRGEEKKETPLSTDATKKEDTISNQSVKTKVITGFAISVRHIIRCCCRITGLDCAEAAVCNS